MGGRQRTSDSEYLILLLTSRGGSALNRVVPLHYQLRKLPNLCPVFGSASWFKSERSEREAKIN
jgi:hypothetical protein